VWRLTATFKGEYVKNRILLLAGLLLVLLLVWWWLGSQEASRQRGGVPERATQADTLTLNRIVLSRHNQPDIVFEKDAGGLWQMTEPLPDRANPNLTKQLEMGLATMELLHEVSSRQSQHATFQVDEVQAARLQGYADDMLQGDIYIGKLAPDLQHVYVRPAGGASVFTATGGSALARLSVRRLDEFRDRRILNTDISVWDSVEVIGQDLTYRLARVDTLNWRIRIGRGEYRDANRVQVEPLLRALGQLNATGFADDSTVIDWDRPDLTIHAWRLGGGKDVIDFCPVEGENNYWLRVAGRPYVFKVFESAFKTYQRDPETLVASPSVES
jgi:hypothetical protein